MKTLGFLTLSVVLFVLIKQEMGLYSPCSQFSDPSRHSLCSTENHPSIDIEIDE